MQLFQFSCHCVIVLSFSLPICLVLLERFNRGKHGLQRKARIFDNSWKAKVINCFSFIDIMDRLRFKEMMIANKHS